MYIAYMHIYIVYIAYMHMNTDVPENEDETIFVQVKKKWLQMKENFFF